jgi:hypothetical protein
MVSAQIFVYLQLLDFLTTMVGFRTGAAELSPFTRWLMMLGPTVGVMASKMIAIGLGAICIWRGRTRILGWVNYYFAGLVIWNLCVILSIRGA